MKDDVFSASYQKERRICERYMRIYLNIMSYVNVHEYVMQCFDPFLASSSSKRFKALRLFLFSFKIKYFFDSWRRMEYDLKNTVSRKITLSGKLNANDSMTGVQRFRVVSYIRLYRLTFFNGNDKFILSMPNICFCEAQIVLNNIFLISFHGISLTITTF